VSWAAGSHPNLYRKTWSINALTSLKSARDLLEWGIFPFAVADPTESRASAEFFQLRNKLGPQEAGFSQPAEAGPRHRPVRRYRCGYYSPGILFPWTHLDRELRINPFKSCRIV